MKKPLNFINYSNSNYNVVSNKIMGDAYGDYIDKKIDYLK
jgi:hypothetical protein